MKKILIVLFVFLNYKLYSQNDVVFDTNYVKMKCVEWGNYLDAPDFVQLSVQMKYNPSEWDCKYSINETIKIDSNIYYVFTIKISNSDNKYEVLTYASKNIESEFYISYLIIYSTNYISGLYPTTEIHSVLNNNILSIFSGINLIESEVW